MAVKEPRLTLQSLKVLCAFLEAPQMRACGADIVKTTGLFPGTAYPILARFKEAGWLQSEWEVLDRFDAGRPPRLYYQLTGAGQRAAQGNLAQVALGAKAKWA